MSQLVILLISILLSSGLTFLMMHLNQRSVRDLLDDQRNQVRELLNRIQSKDLHAFATLQANTTPVSPDEPMIPRSDEAEAQRMMEWYGAAEGIGEVILNTEDHEFLSDLGH